MAIHTRSLATSPPRAKQDDEALAVVEKHVPEQLKTYAKLATASTGKR